MVRLTASILVLAFLSLSSTSLVPEQTSPTHQQCDPNGISKVRVAVTSVKTATGEWTSAVVVNQNGNSEALNGGNGARTDWQVNVEQTANICDQQNSVLETIIYLTAPPPTRENYRPPDIPWNWNCPQCPQCICPTAPTCPSPPNVTPTVNTTIHGGYELHEGLGYYKFHNKPLTWPEAKDKCKDEGAHLIVINSIKENEIVKAYLGLYPYALGATSYYYLWVGANKISNEFTTVLGGKLSETGYERWAIGKPSNPKYAFCLAVARSNTLYHDIVCNWKLAFVCERPLNPTLQSESNAANLL